jgi:hypothetical protein
MADQVSYQERTVIIRKDSGFDEYMTEHHGHTALQNAIGYLAEWNMWANRFDTVHITCGLRNGGDAEIGASYKRTEYDFSDGFKTAKVTLGYFICAIFHPQTGPTDEDLDNCKSGQLARFTFHS